MEMKEPELARGEMEEPHLPCSEMEESELTRSEPELATGRWRNRQRFYVSYTIW